MDIKKICGWILLIAGIIIIIWALYSSYNVFTGKSAVPELFKAVKITPQQVGTQEAQLQNMISEQLKNLIPADAFPKLLNLAAWSILAMILIFGGAQISAIGARLINKS